MLPSILAKQLQVGLPDTPPHLHNIKTIASRVEPSLPATIPTDKMSFFDDLTAYYLNNRYPDYISNPFVKEILETGIEI